MTKEDIWAPCSADPKWFKYRAQMKQLMGCASAQQHWPQILDARILVAIVNISANLSIGLHYLVLAFTQSASGPSRSFCASVLGFFLLVASYKYIE